MKGRALFMVLGLIFWAMVARAQIAVLPFEDLTHDLHGVNVEIASQVADYLSGQGFQVVYPREIIPELSRLRVKSPGWVDQVVARELFKRFKVRYLLLGTVLEMDREEPLLGLSVRILSTENFKLIWGGTVSFSGKDWHPVLGLGKLTFDDVVKGACEALFAGLEEELGTPALPPPTVALDEVLLRPRSVRGGEKVECAVRLRVSGPSPDEMVVELPGGAWRPLIKEGPYYVAFWKAQEEEGRYPVKLVLRWKRGWRLEKRFFLATYRVDNTPPALDMHLYKAQKTPEGPAFKNYIEIRPRIRNGDRVRRWRIEIFPEGAEKPIIVQEGLGELPPRFIWRGTDALGRKLQVGPYRVRIRVWDEAGNEGWQESRLLYVGSPPPAELQAVREGDRVQVSFHLGKHPVPLRGWVLEIKDQNGRLIKEIRGEGPVTKELSLPSDLKVFRYSLRVYDVLGNRLIVRNQRVIPKVMQAKKEEKERPQAEEWVSDF